LADRRTVILGSVAAVAVVAAGGGYLLFGQQQAPVSAMAVSAAPGAEVDVNKLMNPVGGLADHPIGNVDAEVVVIEYLSPTCPHCATFHNSVYPAFKAEYIDTGKIQFIARPFVRNVLDAVVFMLAEAAGPERYHDVLATFFKTQEQWATSQTPNDAIKAIAKQLGFTDASYDQALTNQTLFEGMEQMREQALEEFKLTGTPTFYINGKMLTGDQSLEALKAAIDPLLA
jgi:protein-disulfide isomerase